MNEDSLFTFLRYALDESADLPDSFSDMDWAALLQFGRRQAITGVLFEGVKRIPADHPHPDKGLLLSWMALAQAIEKRNRKLNAEIGKIEAFFETRGFQGCLLKGQGNARLYPHPLSRTPGDIDLWVEGRQRALVDLCREIDPEAEVCYHHIHLHYDDIELEVHFTPSFAGNILYNRRLQRYFKEHRSEQFAHRVGLSEEVAGIAVPTGRFNRIFQASHLMRHYLYEGIGLRQVIDYYYLLKQGQTDRMTPEEKREEERLLRHLYLYRFTRGLMWVLHHRLGLDEKYLIVTEDEKEGATLMEMICKGGNFGRFDPRSPQRGQHNKLVNYLKYLRRTFQFISRYPAEALLGRPFMPVWWRIWVARKGLK